MGPIDIALRAGTLLLVMAAVPWRDGRRALAGRLGAALARFGFASSPRDDMGVIDRMIGAIIAALPPDGTRAAAR